MRMGIQAVPIANPDGTLPGVDPHIPWDEPTCAMGSSALRVEGISRRSDSIVSLTHMAENLASSSALQHIRDQSAQFPRPYQPCLRIRTESTRGHGKMRRACVMHWHFGELQLNSVNSFGQLWREGVLQRE